MSVRKIKGQELYVAIGDNVVGCSQGCSLSIKGEFKNIAPIVDPRAKEQIFDSYSWSVAADGLAALNADLVNFPQQLINGALVNVVVGIDIPGVSGRFMGQAFVQDYELSGNVGAMATYRVTFLGQGPLRPLSAITSSENV